LNTIASNIFLKNLPSILLFLLFILFGSKNLAFAQTNPGNITPSQLSSMSGDDLKAFIQSSKQKGFTTEQIKALAFSKGVSASQIARAEEKINGTSGIMSEIDTSLNISESQSVGLSNNSVIIKSSSDPLFGYDFFNNQNISFQPNVNLATPESYQLGPGDALVISLWGAAENSYDVEVNRNGLVKLPNVGPIVVSGMSIKDAAVKIENALRMVYSGISAPVRFQLY
jgi:hypothetical protein